MADKTDRELLELAAKAAGMVGWRWAGSKFRLLQMIDPSRPKETGSKGPAWNPLTDSGDALELAVKLGIGIELHHDWIYSATRHRTEYFTRYEEAHKSDPLAATRRAIVLAAAAIGSAMGEKL